MTNWEVGKTYKTRDGRNARFLGRLNNKGKPLAFAVSLPCGQEVVGQRYENGQDISGRTSQYDIHPDEPTQEEREWVAQIHEALGFMANAKAVREGRDLITQKRGPASYRLLQLVREIRSSSK